MLPPATLERISARLADPVCVLGEQLADASRQVLGAREVRCVLRELVLDDDQLAAPVAGRQQRVRIDERGVSIARILDEASFELGDRNRHPAMTPDPRT